MGKGQRLLDAIVRRESRHPATRNFVTKKLEFVAADSEVFVILKCTVLTQYSSVTDTQTDGQTTVLYDS